MNGKSFFVLLLTLQTCAVQDSYSIKVFSGIECSQKDQKKIIVMIASYNNKDWYKQNLNSVFKQKYDNYEIVYVDDCSTDGTGDLVENYIKQVNPKCKITLIRNAVARRSPLANHYIVYHMADPSAVAIILDGDDWLASDHVLRHVNNVYSDGGCWLTYGQFLTFPHDEVGFCCRYPSEIIKNNTYRTFVHQPSHLRTYYVWLFQQIALKDLLYNGQFFPMAGDLATSMPMIEMTGGRFKFISRIMYVYNEQTTLNEHKINGQLQGAIAQDIRNRPRYCPLVQSLVNYREMFKNAKAEIIFFSSDFSRTVQLLESIEKFVNGLEKCTVFYVLGDKACEADYKKLSERFVFVDVRKLEKKCVSGACLQNMLTRTSGHVFFVPENVVIADYIDLNQSIRVFEEIKAGVFCFSSEVMPKLSTDIDLGSKIAGLELCDGIFAWQLKYAPCFINNTQSVGILFRKKEMNKFFVKDFFTLQNEFIANEVGLRFYNPKIKINF